LCFFLLYEYVTLSTSVALALAREVVSKPVEPDAEEATLAVSTYTVTAPLEASTQVPLEKRLSLVIVREAHCTVYSTREDRSNQSAPTWVLPEPSNKAKNCILGYWGVRKEKLCLPGQRKGIFQDKLDV